nr:MAG TPA: hypothetical protein [Caudoviricetes sp.]
MVLRWTIKNTRLERKICLFLIKSLLLKRSSRR